MFVEGTCQVFITPSLYVCFIVNRVYISTIITDATCYLLQLLRCLGYCHLFTGQSTINTMSAVNTCRLFLMRTGKVSEKRDLACIIKKHNKNALRLKCYNFRRVNGIVFLFSALHITPFLYGKILFGILHLLLASIATFDTPPGSNPP